MPRIVIKIITALVPFIFLQVGSLYAEVSYSFKVKNTEDYLVRPDKWWITKSMFFGWITKDEYLEHHDPDRWVVGEKEPTGQGNPGGGTGFMQGEGNRPT